MAITKQEMIEALREASRNGYFGGMGGRGGAGGGDGGSSVGGEKFSKAAAAAGDAAQGVGSAFLGVGSKIAEGGAKLSDVTSALREGFAGLGAQGSLLGTALETGSKKLDDLGQNITQNVDTFRKLSDTGLAFGNDIMAMKTQASDARMSIAEMAEVMQKNNSSMLGFGATSAASAKQLSAMSNQFFTSGLGEELRGMGYTTKELNEVLAVSISGSKIKDLNDKASQDKALKSASALATEMDAVAKITGQSKQDQLDELRRKATDGQRMAAIDEAIAKGGEGAKEAFDAISANGKLMGPQFQKLAEDMASMGRPSEGMEQAYGLLSSGAKKLMSEAGEAARSGDRERAAMLTKQAAAEQAAFQNTSQYRTMAAQAGIKETQESYAQGAKFRNALEAAGKELGPMATDSEKTAAALKKLDEQVKAEQQAGGKDDPNATAGAGITRFAINLENRGRDLTKVLNDEVIQPLASKTGPAISALNAKLGGMAGINLIKDQLAEPMSRTRLKTELPSRDGQGLIADQMRKESITEKDKSYPDIKKLNDLLTKPSTSDATAQALNKIAAAQGIKPEAVIEAAMKNKGAGIAELNKQLNAEIPAPIKKLREAEEKTGKTASPTVSRAINREAGIEPTGVPGAVSDTVGKIGKGISAFGDLFTDTNPGKVEIVKGDKKPPTAEGPPATPIKRSEGSLEIAGKMFEDWGKGTMVELHGLEGVMRPQDISKVIESAMGGVRKTMPKIDMAGAEMPKFDLSSMSKTISTSISSVTGGKETTTKGPDMKEMSMSMAKIGMKDDQKKIFDEMMSLNETQAKDRLASLKSEKDAAYAANNAASAAIDAMEDKLEAEGKHIKNMSAEDRKRYDELRKQQNDSYDNINKTIALTKAAEHAEKEKQSLQKLGYDVAVKQEEDKVKIVEDNSEKIKADIADALPVKEMTAKQEEFQSQFTESQQKIIDDYKGYSEENRSFHAQAMEAGVKEDTETAQMIGDRISKMKADIGDRQATEEEQAELANQEANKKMFEQQVEKKKEMLDVMQNLGDYSAKRELELKQKAADAAVTVEDKKTDTIKSDIADALPIDAEAEKDRQAAQAALDSAVPDKLNDSAALKVTAPKRSVADLMGGLDVGANGMPIMRSIDSAKQTLTQKTPSPGKKLNENGEEYTPVDTTKTAAAEKKSESKAATKEATLSDVVSALNTLNKQMGQLIAVNEDGHKSTTKAAKSTASNIYAR